VNLNLLRQPGFHHPDCFFLFGNKITHHRVGPFIAGICRGIEDPALNQEQFPQGIHNKADGILVLAYIFANRDPGMCGIIFKGVVGYPAKGKDALCNGIYLGIGIGIQFFEFKVQVKKSLPFNIPVNPSQVLVIGLEIGEQAIEVLAQRI